MADGEWHHVAVTYNSSTLPGGQEVYIDGVLDTASRTYAGASSTGSVVRLGTADFNKGQAYAGLMDDVYFYDRSLTAAEVDDLYTAPSSGSRRSAQHQLRRDGRFRGVRAVDAGHRRPGQPVGRQRRDGDVRRSGRPIPEPLGRRPRVGRWAI